MRRIFFAFVTLLVPSATFGQCPGGVCWGEFARLGAGPSLMSTGFGESRERFRAGPFGGFHYHRRERSYGGFGDGFGGGGGAQVYSMPVVLGSYGGGGAQTFSGGGCYGAGSQAYTYSAPPALLASSPMSSAPQAYSGGGCYGTSSTSSAVLSYVIPERLVTYRVSPPAVSSAVVEVPKYYPLSSPQAVPSKSTPVPSKITPVPQSSPQSFTSPDLPPAMMRLPAPSKPSPQVPPVPRSPASEQTSPPPAPPLPDQARRDEPKDLQALAPLPPLIRSTVARHQIPPQFADLPPGTVVFHDGALYTIKSTYMLRR